MKKVNISLLCLLLNACLFGQKQGLMLTLEGAPTLSFLSVTLGMDPYFSPFMEGDYNKMPIWGFHTGATAYYPLSKRFGIASGLAIDRKGGYGAAGLQNFTYIDVSLEVELARREYILDYWTIPLSFRMFLDKKSLFFVETGGYVSHLIGQKSSSNIYQLKTTDIGVSFKTGVQLPLGKKWFLPISLLSQHSLTNNMLPTRDIKVRHNTISFGIGLTYQLGQ